MAEEIKQNPYIDDELLEIQRKYNRVDMAEFESQFAVGGKDKQTIIATSNQEIQRLLLTYLQHVGEKRNEDSKSSNLGAAEAFISFIKFTCIDIIRSKCVIRQSLQYMYEIMESKPHESALDQKGKTLWSNLKNTFKTLNNANSEMLDVSHTYFGFLLKFWEALGEFCRQQTKLKPPSMEISINALQKHLYDFIQFKQNYDKAIAKVDEAAQSGITLFDSVLGGQAIADALKTKIEIEEELQNLKNDLKKAELNKIDTVQDHNRTKAQNAGKIAQNKEEEKFHNGVFKTMEEWEKHEQQAYEKAQEKVENAEKIKRVFEGHKMDYIDKKRQVDAKARNLESETAAAAQRDKQYQKTRSQQIDADLQRDKNEANRLNDQAQSLINKSKSARSDAVSTLNSAKYQSDYKTVHHYSYSSRRTWWGWSRSYSYSHTTSQRYTGTASRYRNVAKDLNRMADDIQSSALRLNDKADAMKDNAIKRAQRERELQQQQFLQSIENNKRMLDLAKQIEESAQAEMKNADLMQNEADKQEERVQERKRIAKEKKAQLQVYQELKKKQEGLKVSNIGRLDTENKKLEAENKDLDVKIEKAKQDFDNEKADIKEEMNKKNDELKEINATIEGITKQIGIKGRQQLIDFAKMTMKIFPNLQNVKDGAAALKVGFEDFALVLSLRINSQITIGWYFQITRIFNQVACNVIADALNKRAFNKMTDLNYYDKYGEKEAETKFKQKIAPIIRKCLRVKGDNNNKNDIAGREGINDNDDEKSSTKATNTTQQTLNPIPKYYEVVDQDAIDEHVDKLSNLFVNEESIYGKKKKGIKGWIKLSKEQTKVNREWIIAISPPLCYFFNNMSGALKFAMNQIVMESYRQNESRIQSISKEVKRLLKKEASLKLPTFTFEQKPDPWLRYLKQWKLDKYKDKFEEYGYNDSSIWKDITEEDMKNDLGFKKGDILKFKSRRKEIKEEGDDESDDGGSKKRRTRAKKDKRKKRKKKKYESSSDESSDDESSSDESSDSDDDDDSSSHDDDRRKSKKRSKKSKKSERSKKSKKKKRKKKKRKKRDESSDEDESSDTDDDGSSSDDSRYKKKRKKQNKKKKKKKQKGKKKKKKKDSSSEEDANTESDDDESKDESSSEESSPDDESKKKKKKKNKKKDKVKIKKQNKKKSKKKNKKKKRKESTDESESESESESGSNGSSSSSESEEKPKKKSKGKKEKDKKKSKKGKKSKKSKSKKKVSDDDDTSSSD